MPPEDRRRVLVEATIPLLLTHGRDLTTRQVAEAAGCAEGTIFRVFATKDDLINEALTAALVDEPFGAGWPGTADADLEATVLALVTSLTDHLRRKRALLALMHPRPAGPPFPAHSAPDAPRTDAADHRASDADVDPRTCRRPDPRTLHRATLDAVEAALAPHADALGVGVRQASAALVALTLGAVHPLGGDLAVDQAAVVQILLHGIAKEA